MRYAFADVMQFHRALCPEHIGGTPAVPPFEIEEVRLRLIDEEYGELRRAILNDDLTEIADGAADLIYVVIGTCIAYGIDLVAVWDAVQASNMAKEGGPVVNGKRLKPDGWTPPDVAGILAAQEPIA